MNIPNLPTDNLYKFMALSGLFLIVFVLTYFNYLLREIQMDVHQAEINVGILEIKYDNVKGKVDDAIDLVAANKIIISGGNLTAYQRIQANLSAIKEMKDSKDLIEQGKISTLRMKKETQLIKQKLKRLKDIQIYRKVGYSFGGGLMILGFFLWYYKVQLPMDEKVKKEAQ